MIQSSVMPRELFLFWLSDAAIELLKFNKGIYNKAPGIVVGSRQ
jgi:hypothetical protein